MAEHGTSLILTIALSFSLALMLGFIATKLRLPAIAGYLVAGVIIGPATPGIVADVSVASQLAEIGVMLLLFGVGLHLSLDDLLSVKRISLPGAIVQMTTATVLGTWLALQWGWDLTASVIFGVTLSVASTVVLLKALEARGLLDTMNGRIAVGWLVVEDLATVVALVVLPPLAGQPGPVEQAIGIELPGWGLALVTFAQVAAFMAIMLFFGRRFLPWLLWQVARTGSRELFTLAVIALAIGIAYGAAALFNVSFALGAFVAGMVLRESEFSHRAAEDTLPLRDAFAVLFFVSVGMLLEPAIMWEEPIRVIAVVLIIMLGKSVAAVVIVLVLRYPINSALVMGASLAQIGEFSFILAGLALSLELLPAEGVTLVVAAAFISIALNPLMFTGADIFRSIIVRRSHWARRLEFEADPLAVLPEESGAPLRDHVILVGYGRVGRRIFRRISQDGVPCVVIDLARERIEDLRRYGVAALAGDAQQESVLQAARVDRARAIVIATPSSAEAKSISEVAHRLNPDVRLIMRTHDEDDWAARDRVAADVFYGERELAERMVGALLDEPTAP